jgi:hypothetical protein
MIFFWNYLMWSSCFKPSQYRTTWVCLTQDATAKYHYSPPFSLFKWPKIGVYHRFGGTNGYDCHYWHRKPHHNQWSCFLLRSILFSVVTMWFPQQMPHNVGSYIIKSHYIPRFVASIHHFETNPSKRFLWFENVHCPFTIWLWLT